MKRHLTSEIKTNQMITALWAGLSFVLPAAVICILLAVNRVAPFGNETLITEAGLGWFEDFCRLYESVVSGDGVFYHLNVGLGRGFYSEFAGGLCSPFFFAALFFSSDRLAAACSVITILRAGLSGFFAWLMLRRCTGGQPMFCFALACGYALGGFTACAAYYPSIADAGVFFPLVMLGLYVHVTEGKPLRLFLFGTLFFITCSKLLIGGVVVCFLLYFAFYYRKKNAVLTLERFALFAATLLCAAASSAVLVIPSGAEAIYYKEGAFSRVESIDLLGGLLFGGYGTRSAAGTYGLCLAGLLVMGLVAFLLNEQINLFERIFVGAAAALMLMASAIPVMGSMLYGFCAYTGEKVNMGFVLAAVAVYATGRCFTVPDGMRLWHAGAAIGGYALLGAVSLWLRGAGVFAILAEVGLAVAFAAIFMMLTYDRHAVSLRLSLLTAGVLVLFGMIHTGAVVGDIDSPYRADALASETTARMRVSRLIEKNEDIQGRSMRFFRYRSVDDTTVGGINLARNEAAGVETLARRLGIVPNAEYGGGENFTPLTDILFGTGYVIRGGTPRSVDDLVQSPAYAVDISGEASMEGSPFDVQNRLAESWFGVKELFVPARAELAEHTTSAERERYRWTFNNETTAVDKYTVRLEVGDSLYLLAEDGDYRFAVGSDSRSDWQRGCAGGIYTLCENAPYFERNTLEVYLADDSGEGIPAPAFMILSQDARKALAEGAFRREGEYISHRGSTVRFLFDVSSPKTAVTSIPYEYGWEITVNGKRIKPRELYGGFIGIPLESGVNSVVMKYKPPFFNVSLIVSCLLLVLGLYMTLYSEHEIARRRKVKMAFRAQARNSGK